MIIIIEVKKCHLFSTKSSEYSFIINQETPINQGDTFDYEGHEYRITCNPINHINGVDNVNGIERTITFETRFRAERL
jgi:hypothetical protein